MIDTVVYDCNKDKKYNQSDLEACPFCGSEGVFVIYHTGEAIGKRGFYIHCRTCETSGPVKKSGVEAVESWNTRK